jgi:hypothetical protein
VQLLGSADEVTRRAREVMDRERHQTPPAR